MLKHFMENNRLLQILQQTVSEDEIDKLSAHTLPHISDFNRSVILEMLQDKLLAQEEISEEKVTALKNREYPKVCVNLQTDVR